MSTNRIIIPERAAQIGNFLVGRLLPFRQKRSVGPFVFVDHMGPVPYNERERLDVLPHPHIGLSTLTYLLEGSMVHRDSLGTLQEIQPGEVNWMTAGKGVTHSERSPEHLESTDNTLHGLQIWIALPKEKEACEPSFEHYTKESLPTWKDQGIEFKLIAGEFMHKRSPVHVHSSLFLVELKAIEDTSYALSEYVFGETGIYILEGTLVLEDQSYDSKKLLVSTDGKACTFQFKKGTHVFLFGGEPYPEERYMDWNFVSSDKAALALAKNNWITGNFPIIPNENGFVPYPGS